MDVILTARENTSDQYIETFRVGYCENCETIRYDKGFKRCSKCCAVEYCSIACQKADWKTHKFNCNESTHEQTMIFFEVLDKVIEKGVHIKLINQLYIRNEILLPGTIQLLMTTKQLKKAFKTGKLPSGVEHQPWKVDMYKTGELGKRNMEELRKKNAEISVLLNFVIKTHGQRITKSYRVLYDQYDKTYNLIYWTLMAMFGFIFISFICMIWSWFNNSTIFI